MSSHPPTNGAIVTSTDPADDGRRYDEENMTRYQPAADNYGEGMPPGQEPAANEPVDEHPDTDEEAPAPKQRKGTAKK